AESLVLSVAGASAGLIAAALANPLIVRLAPDLPRLEDAALNLQVLGFATAVVGGTTIFFGLVPGLVLLKRQLATGLRSGDRGSAAGARRTYHALVVGEVALACALLIASALLIRTVQRMTGITTGVSADTTLTASVQFPISTYKEWTRVGDVYAALLERIRQEPGIEAAGAGSVLPLDLGWMLPFSISGQPPPVGPEDTTQADHESVTDGWFETFGARPIAGRLFSTSDTAATPGVVVVNESFAHRF